MNPDGAMNPDDPDRTIVVAGASGFLGRPLVRHLRRRGYAVCQLVRRQPTGPDEVTWDPAGGELNPRVLDGVHAVINLAGAGVGDHRWTDSYKETILRSRVDTTSLIARTAAAADKPPLRILQGSASGYYGSRGDEILTERSTPGSGFLADVVRQWEAAADPARTAGVPVVHLRTGIVFAPGGGGALGRMLPLLRLGLAGPLGSGRQWWPWVTLVDWVRGTLHLLNSSLTGPVNLTAPEPARNTAITKVLARELHRPAVLPVPALALRLVLGEFAQDVLSSARILPTRIVGDGFRYRHPTIQDAAPWLLGLAP